MSEIPISPEFSRRQTTDLDANLFYRLDTAKSLLEQSMDEASILKHFGVRELTPEVLLDKAASIFLNGFIEILLEGDNTQS